MNRHMSSKTTVYRLPLLLMGMVALLGGVLSGLARLAWNVPDFAAAQSGLHATLMIGAFFGTVISLERAVALGRGWAYLAPAAAGFAGLCILTNAPLLATQLSLLFASLILLAGSVLVLRQLRAMFTAVLAMAVACWLIGNLAWLASGANILPALPWWLAFLVLTIAAERLELTRLLPTPLLAKRLFPLFVAVLLTGATLSLFAPFGLQVFAAGLLLLAGWLMAYDIARRNIHFKGITRYIASALLGGYLWLGLAGLVGLWGAFEPGHAWRDAALHALGLGFVFSMVFGHAPIIFPAVARVKIPYHPVFYIPLVALHLSVICRVAGGQEGWFQVRREAGLENALVLLLFIGVMLVSVWRGKPKSRQQESRCGQC